MGCEDPARVLCVLTDMMWPVQAHLVMERVEVVVWVHVRLEPHVVRLAPISARQSGGRLGHELRAPPLS